MSKSYQKELRSNGIYSRNNLPEVKNGEYLINPDEYKSTVTHWIILYENGNSVTYFDSFGA